jgi:hypothetical protein
VGVASAGAEVDATGRLSPSNALNCESVNPCSKIRAAEDARVRW